MAFPESSLRLEELRYHVPRDPNALAALRSAGRLPPPVALDGRAALPRRFTTDSSHVPTLMSLVEQSPPPDGPLSASLLGEACAHCAPADPQTYQKVQLLARKKHDFERLREQKRRFEAEMILLDQQERREEQELVQMQDDLTRGAASARPDALQSEPTTPPEYSLASSGFPTVLSRPNRYSASSLQAAAAQYGPVATPVSQSTSPRADSLAQTSSLNMSALLQSITAAPLAADDHDEKDEAVRQDPTSHHSRNAMNRYSMPVTKSRTGSHEMLALDQTNAAGFLFRDEDNAAASDHDPAYLQMMGSDTFPVLNKAGEAYGQRVGGPEPALPCLTGQQSTSPVSPVTSAASTAEDDGWSAFARRPRLNSVNSITPLQSRKGSVTSTPPVSSAARKSYRRSFDLNYRGESLLEQAPKLQPSLSSNDVPTLKSGHATLPNAATHAQQHLSNHNASLGRVPLGAMNGQASRDVDSRDSSPGMPIGSALHATAPAFGAHFAQQQLGPQLPQTGSSPLASAASPFGVQSLYNGYNSPMMQMTTTNVQDYSQNQLAQYGLPLYNGPAARDSQALVIAQRRAIEADGMSRFNDESIESFAGEIYSLCKDQHGCRFLQRKLEERDPEQIHLVWLETHQYVVDLMTDPFGNYLCQKLFELCSEEERTTLVTNASRDLVRIALNQHGTRALQKMIDFMSTRAQIETIIKAFRRQVVDLIQDLNGNHVIQKCLNKLSPADTQFIFDAVGKHCVDVGTHRHGCCVLQRCIDHASGDQKLWLIRQISNNAFILVQDPFGNYVVQYILDLNEPFFTEPLVAMFKGKVGQLSRQKFSSNVIEKCLRCAQEASRDMLIDEMIQPNEVEKLLRDSFANYVVQTALDYASKETRQRLVDAIRPILPAIRSTTYGRRIQAKINDSAKGSKLVGHGAGKAGDGSAQLPLRQQQQRVGAPLTNGVTGAGLAYGNAMLRGSKTAFPGPTQIGAGMAMAQRQQQSAYGPSAGEATRVGNF